MNPKAQSALINALLNRWNYAHNPAANTTCVVTVPAVGRTSHILDTVIFSQRNMGAASNTVTITVRDASIAGTILSQWELGTAAAAISTANFSPNVKGLKGNALVVAFDPPAASVTQKLTIAGYDDFEGE